MEPWLHLETWLSLLTLTAMEIVLGIDNIVFLSILTGRLPLHQRPRARRLGLTGALGTRLLLLLALNWLMGLTTPILHLMGRGFSGRDLILGGGGLFLIGKATHEIHGAWMLPRKATATHAPKRRLLPWCSFRSRCWTWCFHWTRSLRPSAWRRNWA